MEWTEEMENQCNEARESQWRDVDELGQQAFLNFLEHGNSIEQDA